MPSKLSTACGRVFMKALFWLDACGLTEETGSTRLTDTLLLLSYFQSIFKRNGRCCSEFVQIHGSGVSAICSLSQLCFLVWTQPKAGVEKQTQLQSLGVGMYCHLFKTGSKIEVPISKDISEEGDLGTSLKAWEKGHE